MARTCGLRICLQAVPSMARSRPSDPPLSLPRSPSVNSIPERRNINPLSIEYAFRPLLRIRLTPGGRTCPGKPWDSGDQDSHLVFRYSCPHNHFHAVHRAFRHNFTPHGTHLLPLAPRRTGKRSRSFGSWFKSRSFSAQNHSTSQLLRTV